MAVNEYVPCPLCDEQAVRPLYVHEYFTLGRCTGCGLVRQNPRYTAEHLRQVDYDGAIQEAHTYWGRELDTAGLEHWQSQPLAAYEAGVAAVDALRQRRCQRPAGVPKGLWLDIGASTGQLLVAARNAGWQVGGVEVGSGQVRLCREVHGIEVAHGTLSEARFPSGHAEVISWRHTLEHIHDVLDELAEAARVLRPDGFVLIEVPNYGGVKYRWERLTHALRLRRNPWPRHNIPEHVYYFTARTLSRLLERAGFETLWWTTYGKTRRDPHLLRRMYDRLRDGAKIGNKLRLVARLK